MKLSRHLITAVTLTISTAFSAQSFSQQDYETTVLESIESIKNADIDYSIDTLSNLVDKYPNSKIGHLVMADLLSIRSGSRSIRSFDSSSEQLNGLRDEIKYRWKHNYQVSPALSGLLPSNLVQTKPNSKYSIIVDASQARLYVYSHENAIPQLVDHHYITVGKSGMGKLLEGDLRTPIGVYHVTSYLDGAKLPDRYGPGAFPINYPNKFDRLQKRTGYGIWIHGTESENYNRVPLASDGCVSLSNDAFLELSQYIETDGSTPVIIAETIEWISPDDLMASRTELNHLLKNWLSSWESRDHASYINFYSEKEFQSGSYNYDTWSQHKQRVNKAKSFIDVGVENLSIMIYPEKKDMLIMSFEQDYRSSNFSTKSNKTLYWAKNQSGEWKIIYEG